jgi:beta-galactosidase
VDCGDAADFDFRDGLTVSVWLKSRDLRESRQTLAAKGNDTWSLHSEDKTARLVFALDGPQPTGKDRRKAAQVRSKRPLDDSQWHHVAGVYDGQRIALYVDGELDDSVTASGPVAINTEPVWLGNNSEGRDAFFHGELADVRLYNRGLTETEIKGLHRGAGELSAR